MGHENRSGPLVATRLTRVCGHADRVAALARIETHADRRHAGADRGYDAEDLVNELRAMNVRPHVAQNLTRRRGYAASQRIRKRIEDGFGQMKTVAGLDRPILRGVERVGWAFTFAVAAYDLVRLPKLLGEAI